MRADRLTAGAGAARLSGKVVHGDARGRQLGFPTANLEPSTVPGDYPAPGVWAGWMRWPGQTWRPAVVNVGRRPTFGGEALSIEAHVIDFSGDLYGCSVELRLVRRLRDERRFDSADALAEQIEKDAVQARALLRGRGGAGKPTEEEQ
jgi:riboflavin kinase / FMN adenylyltransferase